jgi:hypothetical protein
MNGEAQREPLERSLARLEELTAAIEGIADEKGREAARELLALLLDLHGRAFERLSAIVEASPVRAALLEQIVEDRDVVAMLLLHGLHPQSVEERLRGVIAHMGAVWSGRGLHVKLLSVGAGFAMVQLRRNGRAEPTEQLRLEIESALTDAAPDLDDILIEMDMTEIYAETAA